MSSKLVTTEILPCQLPQQESAPTWRATLWSMQINLDGRL